MRKSQLGNSGEEGGLQAKGTSLAKIQRELSELRCLELEAWGARGYCETEGWRGGWPQEGTPGKPQRCAEHVAVPALIWDPQVLCLVDRVHFNF